MFAEGEVLDVIKGAGELDSLLDEDCQRVLVAGVHLPRHDLLDVAVQAGGGEFGDEQLRLELLYRMVKSGVEVLMTPALLCLNDTAQGTQIPLLGAFLAFHCVFMATES